MAGDDHQGDQEQAEAANDNYQDESFENYEPTTIDPGWWMFGATFIFCVVLVGILAYLLWLTQRNRKRVEAARNGAKLARDDEEEGKGDKATIQTTSTDDSDMESILTEIEEDDESAVDTDDVPIVNTPFCSCRADEMTLPSVAMTKRRGRQTHGGAVLLNGLFRRNQENQGFVRHKKSRVVFVETTTSSKVPRVPMEIKVDNCSSGYVQMGDKQGESASTSAQDGNKLSDYHQMDDTKSISVIDDKEASSNKQSGHMSKATKQIRSAIKSFGRKVRRVSTYDSESRRILKLAIPYTLTGLVECISEILTLAVIGKLLGTQALSAYLTVHFALSVSTTWLNGLVDSLTTLCSQAIGAENENLAGQYVQIAIIVSQVLYLPQAAFWIFFIKDLIFWFGFSDATAEVGYSYVLVLLPQMWFGYITDGLHSFLQVCDYEQLSAIAVILHSVIQLVAVLWAALYFDPSLQTIGIVQFSVDVLTSVLLLVYIGARGLLREYRSGMIGTFAIANITAVKHLLSTAVPLSISHVLSEGQFQLLYVFASLLGPAEVVAWGLFGELWSSLQVVPQALGDAAEVRCAYLLGAGKPMRAKHSAQKALLLGFIEGVVLVAFLAGCGGHIASWMTNEQTVRLMLTELIPMLCIALFFGTIESISFVIVGAQGCYGLATCVFLIGSWLVTIPLALLSTMIGFNLVGLAASLVIGTSLSGLATTFLLFDSDWYYFADEARKMNEARIGH